MLAELLITCTLLSPLTPDQVANYQDCQDRNTIIIYMKEYIPTITKYFKQEDQELALRIAFCESSGRPNAINGNTDGTKDVGLWQFNDRTWAWLKPKLKITSPRTNVKVSTAVASWLFYNDGSHHWKPSKHCWSFKS